MSKLESLGRGVPLFVVDFPGSGRFVGSDARVLPGSDMMKRDISWRGLNSQALQPGSYTPRDHSHSRHGNRHH